MNICYYYQDLLPGPLHDAGNSALRRDLGYPPYSFTPTSILRPRTEQACVLLYLRLGAVWRARFNHVHFQGIPIRLVSCYALLSGCRLPWPPSSCRHGETPF